jgi:hypothetical protein
MDTRTKSSDRFAMWFRGSGCSLTGSNVASNLEPTYGKRDERRDERRREKEGERREKE